MSLIARCPSSHCHRKIITSTVSVSCVMLMCAMASATEVLRSERGCSGNAGVSRLAISGSAFSGCEVCSFIQSLS
jgi:hypothetical protein